MGDGADGLQQSLPGGALRVLWENVPTYLAYLDFDGTIRALNRAPWPFAKVVGHPVSSYLPDEHVGPFMGALARLAETGEPQHLALISTGGFHWDTVLVLAGDGAPGAALALGREVSSQVRVHDELCLVQRKFEMAVRSTGLGTWMWDAQTDSVRWDDRMLDIFGIARDAAPTSSDDYIALLHRDERGRAREHIRRALVTGEFSCIQYRILRRGEVRWIQCHGDVLENEAGEVVGLLGGTLDVTDHVRVEDKLRQTQKLEAVGQLTAGVAHNFNNLLMAILPNLQIGRRALPAPVRRRLELAEQAVNRAAELVRQMLAFTRVRPEEEGLSADLTQLARAIVDMCRRTFDSSIELVVEVPDEPVHVRGSAPELEQVLLNLLLNARDALVDAPQKQMSLRVAYQRPEPEGAAEATRGERRVLLRVSDTGQGMDEATLQRAFEPFFTTKPPGQGTGLGLFTTYGTVRKLGGSIRCRSKPARGTTFDIDLPSGEPPSARAPSAVPEARGTETVLVVDDEPEVRASLALVFESGGYRALTAGSASEAVDIAGKEIIDLAVLDFSMPDCTGVELADALRSKCDGLPIILVSGYAVEAPLDGVSAVLMKPIDVERLLRRARCALDGRLGAGPKRPAAGGEIVA